MQSITLSIFKPLTRVLAASFIACASTAASAGTVTVTGDTTGAPTWNRTQPGVPPVLMSGAGTDVPYVVTPFQVSESGVYKLLNSSAHDSFLSLYQTAFNPLAQFTNVIAADDDLAGGVSDSAIYPNLLAGVSYFAVSSGFDRTEFGPFTLTINGPGDIIITAVPEPSSFALAGLGLLVLAAARKRAKVVSS